MCIANDVNYGKFQPSYVVLTDECLSDTARASLILCTRLWPGIYFIVHFMWKLFNMMVNGNTAVRSTAVHVSRHSACGVNGPMLQHVVITSLNPL